MNLGLRVRSRRHSRGLSLRDVAARTDLSISFLSQLERDLVAPSISSLKQIATSLDVSVSELLSEPQAGCQTVLRQGDRPAWNLARVRFELLARGDGREMEPQLITYEPGGDSGEHPLTHAGEEFLFILDGALHCWIGDEAISLSSGDSAYFSSNRPHRMRNQSAHTCRCLLVVTPASF